MPDTLPSHRRSESALSDPELASLLANPSGPTTLKTLLAQRSKPFWPHRSERSELEASRPQGQRCEAEEGGWRRGRPPRPWRPSPLDPSRPQGFREAPTSLPPKSSSGKRGSPRPPASRRSTNARGGEALACHRGSTHRLHTNTTLAGTPACFKRTKKATKPRPLKMCLQPPFIFFSQPVSTSPLEPPATSLATSASPKVS